jgi:hypothetical protein
LYIAFVFLVVLSIGAGALSSVVTLNAITRSNHNFCEVVTPALDTLKSQIPKNPAAIKDPKARVNAEQLVDWYHRYQHLSAKLGCA